MMNFHRRKNPYLVPCAIHIAPNSGIINRNWLREAAKAKRRRRTSRTPTKSTQIGAFERKHTLFFIFSIGEFSSNAGHAP